MSNPAFNTVLYEVPRPGVARVTMNRPGQRNAQNVEMTYELNDAFDHAIADDEVKVIVLAGAGPHFSAGHDLKGGGRHIGEFKRVGTWAGYEQPGAEGFMAREEEIYFTMCRRWRELSKPTIAQVHGRVIAGGLMLAWACDLIVASEDAMFQDPVVAFGVNGVEYFMHPWELGVRKAKELLFTGDWLTAEEARSLGMVNQVVAREQLEEFTLAMAEKIATKPSFALKLAKLAVNQAQDAQGLSMALQGALSIHELGHSHNFQIYGQGVDPNGLPPGLRRG
jgi:enoyl-CoA hydratase